MIGHLPVVRTWEAWGRIFTDIALWTPVVREICRRSGLPAREIAPGYPGTNAVFVVDRAWVVKVYAPFCHHDFALERALYPLLARDPAIPAPLLVAQGVLEDRARWPYIVMDYKPGWPIREVRARLSSEVRGEVAAELGRIVRALHRTPLDQLAGLDTSREGWRRFVAARMERMTAELRATGALPPAVLDQVRPFVASVLREGAARPLCLLNGDLTEDHVLLDHAEGRWRISGLLDFADALVGPPAYEWVALWFGALDRDRAGLRRFMAAYAPDVSFDAALGRRALAFTFLHEFGADIIALVLRRMGSPPIASIAALQTLLWG